MPLLPVRGRRILVRKPHWVHPGEAVAHGEFERGLYVCGQLSIVRTQQSSERLHLLGQLTIL